MYYWSVRVLLRSMITALVWGWGPQLRGWLLNNFKFSLVPSKKSVAIAAIERFVRTGEVSPTLGLYAPIFNPCRSTDSRQQIAA